MNTNAKNKIFVSPITVARNSNNNLRLKILNRLAGSISSKQAKQWLAEIKKMRKEW